MDPSSILDCDVFDLADQLLDTCPETIPFDDFASYRILRPIGRGGMGEVFLAEDETARRPVAIKFLRDVWSDPADLRRHFARETQMLAKLEHPYIARLYELGVHPNGTPYFIMEYVEGQPLDQYCRERKYLIEERMRLFRLACEAVVYAHSRAVIHLDLKSANILVTEDGTPKLLDFGIARHLESLDQPVSQTQLVFTPDSAAPEQIRREPVGTYTDVYALGLVLYQLVAGAPAYDLRGCTPGEVEAIITSDREPKKPSASPTRIKSARSAWNDLDSLCLKALKKEVGNRYQSAVELTQDIDRFLRREPLRARRDSLAYRASKFVRRNARILLSLAAVLVLIACLVAFYTVRLTRARDAQLAEAASTARVKQFLLNIFAGGDKAAGPADDLRVVSLLDRGVKDAQELNHDPAIQAELRQTLGGIYEKLGKFANADSLLLSALEERRSVFGPDSQQAAESMVALGLLRADEAKLEDAEKIIRDSLVILRNHFAAGDPAIERAQVALGKVLNERGRYPDAIAVLNEVVQRGPARGEAENGVEAGLTELADAHFYLGHYAISDTLNRQVLRMDEKTYGDHHPHVAGDLANLGHIQNEWGHYAEAEQYYRRALEIDEAWYGKDHPDTADAATYVAQEEVNQARYGEAAVLLEGALPSMERAYGRVHPRVALVLNSLGIVHLQMGRLKEAEAEFERAIEIYRSAYGDEHQMTAVALANLGSAYLKEKQYVRAEAVFRVAIRRYTKAQSPDHLNTGIARIKLGRALLRELRYRDAEIETLAGYVIVAKQSSPSVSWLNAARDDLVKEYRELKQPDKADHFQKELAAVKVK